MSAAAIVALSVTYSVVGLAATCRAATLLAWEMMRRHNVDWASYGARCQQESPSFEQWFGGIGLGLFVGVAWPLAGVLAVFRHVLFAPPREVREKRQAEYIVRLERELGITPSLSEEGT